MLKNNEILLLTLEFFSVYSSPNDLTFVTKRENNEHICNQTLGYREKMVCR